VFDNFIQTVMNELWKDIPEYEGYYRVSNFGNVKSLDRMSHDGKRLKGIILSFGKTKAGYRQICLCKNGKTKWMMIHRIVAAVFIPNTNNYPEVNHIDENKGNNHVSNLEWCTRDYNNRYSNVYKKGLVASIRKTGKRVVQFKNGEFIQEFSSMREAERLTGIQHESISACCRGKLKEAGRYKWAFNVENKYARGTLFDETEGTSAMSCMSYYSGLCE
jgi:hypothetical protein